MAVRPGQTCLSRVPIIYTVACRYIPLSGIHREAVVVHLAGALVWLLVLWMLV